jgi:hypothetical protein
VVDASFDDPGNCIGGGWNTVGRRRFADRYLAIATKRPEMLSHERDRSQDFRDALEGIAQKHQECRYIVDPFLNGVS